mmetsp:Transcript_15876/g.24360  ORF Transcript_15876/g.24360 Transcript_15876/m.24360 type:complete len:231 (-) Transcript_15876:181-873(-)
MKQSIQCDVIYAKQKELGELRSKGDELRSSHRAKVQKLQLLLREASKAKVSHRPLHEYTSALDLVQQAPFSPPSYVLQKQALLCRELHRVEVQINLIDWTNQFRSEMSRSIKRTIQTLDEERANMEVSLLKEMVLLDDDLKYLKGQYDSTLTKQGKELKLLRKIVLELSDERKHVKSSDIIKFGEIKQDLVTTPLGEKNKNDMSYKCDSVPRLNLNRALPEQKRHHPPVA